MADIATYERDVGRAHPDYFAEFLGRMDEARAGVAAVLGTDVAAVGLTHADDRRDERREPPARLAARRPGRDHDQRARRRPRSAVRAARAVRRRDRVRGRRRGRRRRRGRSPPSMPRSRPAPGWSRSRTCCGRPARSCPSRRSRSSPTSAARSSSSTAPRPPARSRSDSTSSARTPTPCRPRSGCSARRGWARSWSIRARSSGSIPALGGWFTFEEADGTGRARWWPDARRFEATGFHRPSVVGHGPLDRLAVDVRRASSSSTGAGRRWPRRPRTASPAIPGVTVLTPRHAMATLVTFRIAGWPAEAALDELGSRVFAIARTIEQPRRAPDQRRLLHHGRRAGALRRGGRAAGRAHARDAAAAARR